MMALYHTVYCLIVAATFQVSIGNSIAAEIVSKSHVANKISDNVCRTLACNESAAAIIKNMDTSVDPCDNFYKFSCGSFISRVTVPDGSMLIDAFTSIYNGIKQQIKDAMDEPSPTHESKYITAVKNFFKACIDEAGIEERGLEFLKQKMKELGGWPVLEGQEWNETNFNWIESIYKFREVGWPINIFWNMYLDGGNNTILQLQEPSLTLSREESVGGINNTKVEAYYKLMVDIAVMLGAPRDNATVELRESLEFELALAKITSPSTESYSETTLTITELTKKFSSIPWNEYINNILAPHLAVSNIEAVVSNLNFTSELLKLMSVTPKKIQANFMMWQAAKFAVPYLNENMSISNYAKKMKATTKPLPRWEKCMSKVEKFIPTHILYAKKYSNEAVKNIVIEMEKDIRSQFENISQTIGWMDEESRKNGREKVAAVSSYVGYPDEFLNDTTLEATFKGLEFNDYNYLENEFAYERYKLNEQFSISGSSFNKVDWKSHALIASTNIQYVPWWSSIEIPAGILQGAFFNASRPNYMNYGAIGSIIGHELTHAFNDEERQYYKCGREEQSFVDEGFLRIAQCFVNQYSNYTVEETGKKISGTKTRDENIADNAGFKLAYLAYKDWVRRHGEEQSLAGLEYNSQQMFWISAANAYCAKFPKEFLQSLMENNCHCISEFRILGTFQNSPEFAADFNCPVGSKMNPIHKCTFW